MKKCSTAVLKCELKALTGDKISVVAQVRNHVLFLEVLKEVPVRTRSRRSLEHC